MKSAIIRQLLAVLLLLFLSACSGGGDSKGSTKVTLRIGAVKSQKTLFAGMSSASSTTFIPSVVKTITVSISAPDMSPISRTVPVMSGSAGVLMTFTVPNGTGRKVTVSAADNHGNFPFSGEALVNLTGVDVAVPVRMVEDPLQAIKARLYLYVKDTIEARGSSLIPSDLDPFYSIQYGVNSGLSRAQTINDEVKSFNVDMNGKVMAGLSISLYQPDPPYEKYIISGKAIFSDGSYSFPDDGFVMIKENGEWKFVGNGFKAEIKFKGGSFRWVKSGTAQTPYESGLIISVRDSGNFGINSAVVTGPGLPAGGVMMQRDQNSPSLGFSTTPYNGLPGTYELYSIDDATLAAIADLSVYTFRMYDQNNALVEQRIFTLPTRPWLRSELTAGHFPSLSVAPVSVATGGHFLADARIGGNLTMAVAQPAAFAASWLMANLSYFGWDGINMNGFWLDRGVALTGSSATISSVLPLVAIGGAASVTAEDFDRQRESRTYWLFDGPANAGPLDFIAAVNSPVAGGITAPASTTVWSYGSAAPTVTWNGFSSVSMVDIYLLADDPQRLMVPQTSGNPYPGVVWSRLTSTPIAAVTGSFTLPGPPETLNLAGRGCRVLVVSALTGEWALSAPFTISP